MDDVNLSEFKKDQLIEVINIGAGNASISLSQLVNKQVSIHVPKLYVDKIESVLKYIGTSDELMTVVLIKLLGDVTGTMVMMFQPKDAIKLASLMNKKPYNEKQKLNYMDRSALKEMGNILSGTALNALAKLTKMYSVNSLPDSATDMVGSMIDNILADIGQDSEVIMSFKVMFQVKSEDISGQLFFLFDPKTTNKIIQSLNNK